MDGNLFLDTITHETYLANVFMLTESSAREIKHTKQTRTSILLPCPTHVDGAVYSDDIDNKYGALFYLNTKGGVLFTESNIIKESPCNTNPYQLNHSSELLEVMQHCIAENWENHNSDRPPKNEAIDKWFEDKYPNDKLLSTNIKEAIRTIIRPTKYK